MRIAGQSRFARADLIQFLEYFIGGMSYFWSGYLVFAVCYSGLAWDWLPSKMFSDAVGCTVNYLVQRYWAFNKPQLAKHEAAIASKYIFITLVNLLLDYLIIWGLKHAGVSPYIGFFVSATFFTIWNYLWYRSWVFYSKNRGAKKEAKK